MTQSNFIGVMWVVSPINAKKRQFNRQHLANNYHWAHGGLLQTIHLGPEAKEKQDRLLISAYSGKIQEGVDTESYLLFLSQALNLNISIHQLGASQNIQIIKDAARGYDGELCDKWDKKAHDKLYSILLWIASALIVSAALMALNS